MMKECVCTSGRIHGHTVWHSTAPFIFRMLSLHRILLLISLLTLSNSYPLVIQVDDSSKRCFRINVPEDDDVAVIALVIPSEDEIGANSAIESWHVEQVHKLTKMQDQHGAFPRQLPDEPPSEVAQAVSTFLQGAHGEHPNVQLTITATPISDPTSFDHQYATKYFTPTVVNYIAHSTNMKRQRHRPEEDNMEGYGICLFNMGDQKQMQVIYDMVLLSEAMGENDDMEERHQLEKDAHLTPLENTLDASINAANSVLREMKYMEKREQRMRQTAEAINTRVRWFSYFSVAVLLGVTYIQVSYLKRYFKKKKLM